jgi:hypothetical protein
VGVDGLFVERRHFRDPEIDDEFKFGCLQNRQVAGLFALEDAAGIDADLMRLFSVVGTIAHQAIRVRVLGLAIPPGVLAIADEVIE